MSDQVICNPVLFKLSTNVVMIFDVVHKGFRFSIKFTCSFELNQFSRFYFRTSYFLLDIFYFIFIVLHTIQTCRMNPIPLQERVSFCFKSWGISFILTILFFLSIWLFQRYSTIKGNRLTTASPGVNVGTTMSSTSSSAGLVSVVIICMTIMAVCALVYFAIRCYFDERRWRASALLCKCLPPASTASLAEYGNPCRYVEVSCYSFIKVSL